MLYGIVLWRAFRIADRVGRCGGIFGARLVQGIALLLALQVIVNFAVNLGVVPTKGLGLPMMSYGGSSMLACGIAVGLLLSVDRSVSREASGH